ncbi:MAG: methyltransferase [Phycisphaerales bacterium]
MATTDTTRLLQMITGMIGTQAVRVAAELAIADHLACGPATAEDLARRCDAHADSLRRLLRYLCGEGVFVEDESGRFALTPLGECLRSDSPTRVRDFARMLAGDCASAWNELIHSVRTGHCAFEHVHGAPLFRYLAAHPEKAHVFDSAMTGVHGPETGPMIDAYDFSGFETIVDVGGASGAVLLEILSRNPRPRGIVFDLDHVAEQASARIAAAGLADRAKGEGGSFFERVPEGADCYVMRHIIHDWNDEQSIGILRRCRDAMRPDGKVLVVESVIPPGNEPHPSKMFDLIMLAIPGGRERTRADYERLYSAAGLRVTRVVPTASPVSVVEGVRV